MCYQAEQGLGEAMPADGLQLPWWVLNTTQALENQQAVECQACTINLHMTLILLSLC